MDYFRIYDRLIERAKNRLLEGYNEQHHIVPVCMGGTNEQANLVSLTPEEHYVAHQLLVKMYPSNRKLLYAAKMMGSTRPTNKLYGWLKRRFSDDMRNHGNPMKGKGYKRKEYIAKYGDPVKNRRITEQGRKILSEKMKRNNPNADGHMTRRSTYLIDPSTLQLRHSFISLRAAEKFTKANHQMVYYNRKRNKTYRGFLRAIGDAELKQIIERNQC
jgi:hypothetical protein